MSARSTRTRARPRHADYTRTLPNETLDAVFRYLGQPDALNAAGTCQRWHAIAQEVPTYYAHVALNAAELDSRPDYTNVVLEFAETLPRAAATGLRLRLVIHVIGYPEPDSDSDEYPDDELDNAVEDLIKLLPQYLPRLLKLDVKLGPEWLYTFLQEALTQPAPVLRSLALEYNAEDEQCLSLDSRLSGTLFASSSPKLTSLDLCGISFDLCPVVPAFAKVRTLRLQEIEDTLITSIPTHFPVVKNLELVHLACVTSGIEPQTVIFDHLSSLEVIMDSESPDCPERLVDLLQTQAIPRVDVQSSKDAPAEYLLTALTKHLAAPVHLTCSVIPPCKDDTCGCGWEIPELILVLHAVSNDLFRTLKLSRDALNFPAIQPPLAIAAAISDICLSQVRLRWLTATFTLLPALATLSVDLDGILDLQALDPDTATPSIQCPKLDIVIVHSSWRNSKKKLKHVLGVLRLFSVHPGGCTKPILILQGALAPLRNARPLAAITRFVSVERSTGFVKRTSCCG